MSCKYKVGDKVKIIRSSMTGSKYEEHIGQVCVVHTVLNESAEYPYLLEGNEHHWQDRELELIKTKTFMTRVSIMMKKLLDGDTQTLVKAGFINGDLELTDEGSKALLAVVFTNLKAELVKIAQEQIDEEEKDK